MSPRVIDLTLDQLRDLIREELRRRDEPEYLSPAEAAGRLSVSPRTVRRWLAGGMPCVGEGRLRRVRLEDCRRWLANEEEPAGDVALRLMRGGR